MNLCSLDGKSFIISLALILLMLGGLVFYALKRFTMLENSIIQQGRILHSFMMRAEQVGPASSGGTGTTGTTSSINSCTNCQCAPGQCKCTSGQCSKQLATESAITSAKQQLCRMVSDKIEVSDDDCESDSNSDSGSDTGSDSSDDSKLNLKNISDIKDIKDIITDIQDIHDIHDIQDLPGTTTDGITDVITDGITDVKIIAIEFDPINIGFGLNLDYGLDLNLDLSRGLGLGLNLNNNLELNFKKCRADQDSDSDSGSETDLGDLIQDITVDLVKETVSDDLSVINKNMNKMKVTELRILAVKKNLVENMDLANKIKKEALLKLLTGMG